MTTETMSTAQGELVQFPKRRGRPPKNGESPLSNKERQQQYRLNAKARKEAEIARLKQIAEQEQARKDEAARRLEVLKEEANRQAKSQSSLRTFRDGILTLMAAAGSAFTSVCSWWISHHEATSENWKWGLVALALAFSAPNLVSWIQEWSAEQKKLALIKAIGLAFLMEIVTVFSTTWWLSGFALTFLIFTNMMVGLSHYQKVLDVAREERSAAELKKGKKYLKQIGWNK